MGAVREGHGRHAVRRAAADHVDAHLAGVGVADRNDNDPVMLKRGLGRQDGVLLSAVLRRGRRHHGGDLVDQGALRPERPGLVEEVLDLGGHHPEPGRDPDDEAVILRQFGRVCERGVLFQLVVRLAGHMLGHEFGHPLEGDLGPGGAGAFGRGSGHCLHVPEARVVQSQDPRQRSVPLFG